MGDKWAEAKPPPTYFRSLLCNQDFSVFAGATDRDSIAALSISSVRGGVADPDKLFWCCSMVREAGDPD